MIHDQTDDRICDCIREFAADPERAFLNSDHLVDGLGLDSVDLMELTIALEDEFDIEITDDDIEHAQTVGDVVALVRRLVAG